MKNASKKTEKTLAAMDAAGHLVKRATRQKKNYQSNNEEEPKNEESNPTRIETLLTLLVNGQKLAVEIRQNHYQGDDSNPWFKHVVILELTQFEKLVSMVEEKSKNILHLLENQQKYEKDNQHS